MKRSNLRVLLYAVLLLGLALLNNACKRYSEIYNQPLTTKQDILKARSYVDSVVLQQGSNAFVKKMGFEILWEKAIIDSANNIRVPISFSLSRLKLKDGQQISKANIKDIFELYIKKDKGQIEISIMQFMHIKDKYYPFRFSLTGEMKTKLGQATSIQNTNLPKGGGKISLSPNAMMIYESEAMGIVTSMYGTNITTVLIFGCSLGTVYDPQTCMCDFIKNVATGGFYPEFYLGLVRSPGSSIEFVPYPFSFHPSSIVPDPKYPDGPIGGGGGSGGSGGGNGMSEGQSNLINQLSDILSSEDSFYFDSSILTSSPTFNSVSDFKSYMQGNNLLTVDLNVPEIIIDSDTKIAHATFNLTFIGGVKISVKLIRDANYWLLENVSSSEYGASIFFSWSQSEYSSSTNGNEIIIIVEGYLNYNVFIAGYGTVYKQFSKFQVKLNKQTGKITQIQKL